MNNVIHYYVVFIQCTVKESSQLGQYNVVFTPLTKVIISFMSEYMIILSMVAQSVFLSKFLIRSEINHAVTTIGPNDDGLQVAYELELGTNQESRYMNNDIYMYMWLGLLG